VWATIAAPFATIHNYNSRFSGKAREPQKQQKNAVATPSILPNPECSVSDTRKPERERQYLLMALG